MIVQFVNLVMILLIVLKRDVHILLLSILIACFISMNLILVKSLKKFIMINSNMMGILKPVLLGLIELRYVRRELTNICGMKRKIYITIMTLLNMNNQFMNLLPLFGHFGQVVLVKNRLKNWCMYANINILYNILSIINMYNIYLFNVFNFNNYRKISLPKFEVLGGLI